MYNWKAVLVPIHTKFSKTATISLLPGPAFKAFHPSIYPSILLPIILKEHTALNPKNKVQVLRFDDIQNEHRAFVFCEV